MDETLTIGAASQTVNTETMDGVIDDALDIESINQAQEWISFTEAMRLGQFLSHEEAQAAQDADMNLAQMVDPDAVETVNGTKQFKGSQKRKYTADQLKQFITLILDCVSVREAANKSGIPNSFDNKTLNT